MTGVNVVGLSAFSCYVLFYYAMSGNRRRIAFKILAVISLLTAIVLVCSSREGPDSIFWSAICACGSSLVACASPLASLKRVLRTRSSESLPFAFIAFSFLNSLFWSWYGILASNRFIVFPNAVGAFIAGCQLLLFLFFPAKPRPQSLLQTNGKLVSPCPAFALSAVLWYSFQTSVDFHSFLPPACMT